MIQGIVQRDDNFWQGHPDIAMFHGNLFVCYRQSPNHLSLVTTEIKITSASPSAMDKWTTPLTVASGVRFNCPRLSVHKDRLWLICDVIPGNGDYILSENGYDTRVWLWSSINGYEWEGPIKTNIQGIVPDRLFSTPDGHLLIASHTRRVVGSHLMQPLASDASPWLSDSYGQQEKGGRLVQNVWRSRLMGDGWQGPIRVADVPGHNFCEASLFDTQEGLIGCLLRENSRRGDPAYFMLSGDNGLTWSGPYKTRMFGCHRPVIGRLKSGKWLTTYREQMNSIKKPYWARNTFACLSEYDSWKGANSFVHSIILPIDHDSSKTPDGGYTGWVQLDDESICIVNYITDDAPKPYIKYYVIKESDF